ncbi:MAG: THUMP domain-containing protein [Cyanobacteria bacterium P01_H01_bin.15]
MPKFFATVARGLEELAATELRELEAQQVEPGFCGVSFEGERELLYRVNLWARLPFRILRQLDIVSCRDGDDLFAGIQTIDWDEYLSPEQTLAVTATGKNRQLNHTHFTALQVKNAIVAQQMRREGQRSDVDTDQPDVRINVHVRHERATVSLDSSGESLHRRGYRPAVGSAPLKESLAAALIRMSGWQPDQAFLDPLCGSGTLPLEACLRSLKVAPGLFRNSFGFETWLDFDASLFERLLQEAEDAALEAPAAGIWGSDRDAEVLRQARSNARQSGVIDHITFAQQELAAVEAPADSGIIICNPPYGERLGDSQSLGRFYRLLGDVLKQRFKGWTAYIISGNKDLAKTIGLKSASRQPVFNGTIACQFLKYELY